MTTITPEMVRFRLERMREARRDGLQFTPAETDLALDLLDGLQDRLRHMAWRVDRLGRDMDSAFGDGYTACAAMLRDLLDNPQNWLPERRHLPTQRDPHPARGGIGGCESTPDSEEWS